MPSSMMTLYEVTVLASGATPDDDPVGHRSFTTATFAVCAYGWKAAKLAVEAHEVAQMRLGGAREVIAVRDRGPANIVRLASTASFVPQSLVEAMRRELAERMGVD